jgi:hypothetical protein
MTLSLTTDLVNLHHKARVICARLSGPLVRPPDFQQVKALCLTVAADAKTKALDGWVNARTTGAPVADLMIRANH